MSKWSSLSFLVAGTLLITMSALLIFMGIIGKDFDRMIDIATITTARNIQDYVYILSEAKEGEIVKQFRFICDINIRREKFSILEVKCYGENGREFSYSLPLFSGNVRNVKLSKVDAIIIRKYGEDITIERFKE